MSLHKRYIRDGSRHIIGSVTEGFNDDLSVVRDDNENIIGRTSGKFNTTRDQNGKLISVDSSDPGLVLGRRD